MAALRVGRASITANAVEAVLKSVQCKAFASIYLVSPSRCDACPNTVQTRTEPQTCTSTSVSLPVCYTIGRARETAVQCLLQQGDAFDHYVGGIWA